MTAALNETKLILLEIIGDKFITKTEAANNKLVAMENQSFAFIREGKPEAALKLLLGKEYQEQKKNTI